MLSTMAGFDRRSALKMAGGLAAGATLPRCGGASSAIDTAQVTSAIDTVVVLMMENRSFDHYLGALSLEGRDDVDGLTLGMSNPDPDGRPVLVHEADANCIVDPPHSWRTSRGQFADGANDGFVTEYARRTDAEDWHRVMGYFDRRLLPAYYHFADHFTVCDRWYASLMTSTWPNRFYMLAAQNGGYQGNAFEGDYSFFNVYDRLKLAERTWAAYYGNLSFSLVFPRNYPQDNFRNYDRFFADAAAGTLPNLTVVEPLYGRNDDHPPNHPLAGQVMVASVYDALLNSPQWERCLFIVTYDEHGGFYDHVPPPKAADARAAEGFDQLGFRVPSLVAGPYVKPSYVSHAVYDHSSVIAFLSRLWDMPALTERDAAANDLFDVLDPARIRDRRPRAGEPLPRIDAAEEEIYAPECVYDVLDAPRPVVHTGQLELEQRLEAHYGEAAARRRRLTDQTFRAFNQRAVSRRVLRIV